jgi:hypothetical protein
MPTPLTQAEYAAREEVNREVLNKLVDTLFAEAESRTRNRSHGEQEYRVAWEDGYIRLATLGGRYVFKPADLNGPTGKINPGS